MTTIQDSTPSNTLTARQMADVDLADQRHRQSMRQHDLHVLLGLALNAAGDTGDVDLFDELLELALDAERRDKAAGRLWMAAEDRITPEMRTLALDLNRRREPGA